MAVKRTTSGITTTFAADGKTYNNHLYGTYNNDELDVDNNSILNFDIYADFGQDAVTVAYGGSVKGSILANVNDSLGDTISVTKDGTVLNSVLTGNGDDNITLAGTIGDNSTSDRISTGDGEDSLTIASTSDVNVLQIHMGSGANTLTIEDGAHVSFRSSSFGAGIYTEAGDDILYLGGTYRNVGGNDVDTYLGSDSITLGRDFSFSGAPGGDGEFLIMGGGAVEASDTGTDTLNLSHLYDAGRVVEHTPDPTNSENGTVILTDGTKIRYTGIESIVTCFTRGTKIVVAGGEVAVEDLYRGQLVQTRDSGLQAIRWIGARKLSATELKVSPNLCPIRIRAAALGKNTPESDLLISPQHRILVRSKIVQRMFEADEVLVAAKHLLECEGIEIAEDITEVEYFHMLFDRHEIIYSHGAETESLHTGPQALKSVSPAAREEIFTLFPELQGCDPTAIRPLARHAISGREGRNFARRSSKNKQPLFSTNWI